MDPESFEKGKYAFTPKRGKHLSDIQHAKEDDLRREDQEKKAQFEQYKAEQEQKKQRTWSDYSNIPYDQVAATLIDYGYDPEEPSFWSLDKGTRRDVLDESRYYTKNPKLRGLMSDGFYDETGPDYDTRMANRRFYRGKQAAKLLKYILADDIENARKYAKELDTTFAPGETRHGEVSAVTSPSYLARQFNNYMKYNEANATKDARFTPEQIALIGKFMNGEVTDPLELKDLPLHSSLQQLLHIASFKELSPEDETFKEIMDARNKGRRHFQADPNKKYYTYGIGPAKYLQEGSNVYKYSPDFSKLEFGREFGFKNYNPVIPDDADLSDAEDGGPEGFRPIKDMMRDRKKY